MDDYWDDKLDATTMSCPHCDETTYWEFDTCPHCGGDLNEEPNED